MVVSQNKSKTNDHKIRFNKFIHISTVDVYPDTSSIELTKESLNINTDKLGNYGFHKLYAENYVKHFCENFLIFRLPGLVGNGLTKNPAYDFIHPHKKVMISERSQLNFIHTDFIAESIFKIAELGLKNETYNLAASNSIEISKIVNLVGFNSDFNTDSDQHIQNYKINVEKISRHITLRSCEEAIQKYFNELKANINESK